MSGSTPLINSDEIEFLDLIGEGIFGEVHSALCRGKKVAVKTLLHMDLDPTLITELIKEVDIMRQLYHPNIVLLLGACLDEDDPMIVTELMKGTIDDIIQDESVSLLRRLVMAKDIAQGMNWLHLSDPPIIHRDLKPNNLLVDESGRVKICDFGLSAVKVTDQLRDKGMAVGTPLWMAPEVLAGGGFDEKSDVYSFGIVLWEILTGEPPFEEFDDLRVFKVAVCRDDERPIIPNDMHPCLKTLLEKCWGRNPEDRVPFSTIIDLLDDAIVYSLLPDEEAELWKGEWNGQLEAPFDDWYATVLEYLGRPVMSSMVHTYHYSAMKALMVNKEDKVTIDRFSSLVQWFGPLKQTRKEKNFDIVEIVTSVIKNDWFHGDIPKQEAESLLTDFEVGTFLVRLSTTNPEKTPFTISKVNKNGSISHQRVYQYNNSTRGHYIVVKTKDGSKRLSSPGTIEDLIDKTATKLHLIDPCPGRKYTSLNPPELEGYLSEDLTSSSGDYY